MAMDSSTKAILVRLKIAPEQWDNFVKKSRADLQELHGAALASHTAKMQRAKDEIAQAAKLNAEEQKQMATAKLSAELDKAKVAAQRTATESVRALTAQAVLATAEAKKQAVEADNLSKIELAQLNIKKQQLQVQQQQFRLTQQQSLAAAKGQTGGTGGGGGIIGSVLQGTAGLLGGGPLGLIAAGSAAGNLLAHTFEILSEKLKDLAHEMVDATGKSALLQEQFIKLSNRAGQDPAAFLNRLNIATRGLVKENDDLVKVANQFMAGPLKLQPPQIEKLTQLTVALARANGRDATEAMNALSRAAITGRVQLLGMVTGIDRASLSARGMGGSIRGVAQEQLQLGIIMDAMTRRFAEVGTPATTLVDIFTQIHAVQRTFVEDMAYSLAHSQAFAKAIQSVSSWILKATPVILDFAASIGDKLGSAFADLQPILSGLIGLFETIQKSVKVLWGVLKDLTPIEKATKALKEFLGINSDVTFFQAMMVGTATAINFLNLALANNMAAIQGWKGVIKGVAHGDLGEAKAAFDAYTAAVKRNNKAFEEATVDAVNTISGDTGKVNIGQAGPSQKTPPDPQIEKQVQKLKLQLAKETAKEQLNIKLEEIDAEKAANKDAYESGLEAESDYLKKEHELREASLKVKLAQIEQDRKAQLAELAFESRGTMNPETGEMVGSMDPKVKSLRTQLINKQAADQVSAAKRSSAKEDLAITKEELNDELAARKEYVSAVNKINQEGVQERLKQNQEEFKSGSISPDEYLNNAKALYAEERDLKDESAQQLYDVSKKNDQDLAKLRITNLEGEVAYQKQITDLVQKEGDLRLQYLDTKYNLAKKYLEAEIKLQTNPGNGTLSGQGVEEEKALQNITEQHIRDLITEQQRLGPMTADNANDWLKIAEQIGASREELVKVNEELFKARDIGAPLGELFGQIAKDLGSSLPKGWQQMLTKLSATMKEMSALMQKQAGVGGGNILQHAGTAIADVFRSTPKRSNTVAQTAQQLFESAQQKSAQVIDNFKGSVDTARTKMLDFAQAAQQAVLMIQGKGGSSTLAGMNPISLTGATTSLGLGSQAQLPGGSTNAAPQGDIFGTLPGHTNAGDSASATGGLIASLTKLGKSADGASESLGSKLTKAVGGVMSAAQSVMGTVGTVMGSQTAASGAVGGIFSGAQTGMMLGGPIGAAVGAVAGGVFGGLIGAKRQALAQDITKVKAQLQGILDSLQAGTITLGDAINTLRKERQSAISMLAGDKGSKKDPTAVTGAITAIDQEIQKLVDEQKQVLDDMTQQIQMLSQPTAFQPIVQQLDDIIKKYQQFASAAAGNTAEVAAAQTYLNLALQQYSTTISNQLSQANAQAVQDALHLLDLEKQRYDLIQNEAKQEYDIMTQGVLTRQRGTAAVKGQEIAQLRYQRDQQLIQMNEEIAVSQEKVAAETKMFGLASDRITLEKQLLILQEQQSDLQLANILALQQTLASVNTGIATGNLPQAIQSGGSLSTGSQLLNQILGLLGLNTGTVPTGTSGSSGAINYLAEIPQQWQGAAQFMNGIYPNFLHFLIGGLEGSGQARKSASDQATGAKKELMASGYDATGFLRFIQTGSLPSSDPIPPAVPSPDGSIPSWAAGTPYVPQDGLALLHQGEAVIPANLNTGMPGVGSGMSIQYSMLDVTNARAAIEAQIVAMRTQLLNAEIVHMNNVQQLLSDVRRIGASGSTTAGTNILETAMQNLYMQRGRYGLGGFTRQSI